MPHRIYIFAISALLIAGCSSPFLDNSVIQSLTKNKNSEESKTVYRRTSISFLEDGTRIDSEHVVILTGSNKNTHPDLLSVHDDDIVKLISFRARLIKNNNEQLSYGKSDLFHAQLSTERRISDEAIYMLPILENLSGGDAIEEVYVQEHRLPQLGIHQVLDTDNETSENVRLQVNIPKGKKAAFLVLNYDQSPIITKQESGATLYQCEWGLYTKPAKSSPYAKKMLAPGIVFTYPVNEAQPEFTWKDFGNWYWALIRAQMEPGEEIHHKAADLTAGMKSNLEKLSALFNYCQKTLRYEQVYLTWGEIIPNDCNTILRKKYADCKDYATLFYALAKSIGLNVYPALCYRGRGYDQFHDIAVNQFNHMIAYYREGDVDYWFDGTNRNGKPGVTTEDLINQYAVVIEPDNSRPVQIKEDKSNLLLVTGTFTALQSDLNGELVVKLSNQYSGNFRFVEFSGNKQAMQNYIMHWVKKNLNSDMSFSHISGAATDEGYTIVIRGTLQNALTVVDSNYYFSLLNTFPNLIPPGQGNEEEQTLFYYPGYNRVRVELTINNLINGTTGDGKGFHFSHQISLPPGPFTEQEKKPFRHELLQERKEIQKKMKLIKTGKL